MHSGWLLPNAGPGPGHAQGLAGRRVLGGGGGTVQDFGQVSPSADAAKGVQLKAQEFGQEASRLSSLVIAF